MNWNFILITLLKIVCVILLVLATLPGKLGQNVRVLRAPCMGACDQAPVVAVGHVQTNPWMPGEIVFCWETGGKAPQRTWTVMADGTGLRPPRRELRPRPHRPSPPRRPDVRVQSGPAVPAPPSLQASRGLVAGTTRTRRPGLAHSRRPHLLHHPHPLRRLIQHGEICGGRQNRLDENLDGAATGEAQVAGEVGIEVLSKQAWHAILLRHRRDSHEAEAAPEVAQG